MLKDIIKWDKSIEGIPILVTTDFGIVYLNVGDIITVKIVSSIRGYGNILTINGKPFINSDIEYEFPTSETLWKEIENLQEYLYQEAKGKYPPGTTISSLHKGARGVVITNERYDYYSDNGGEIWFRVKDTDSDKEFNSLVYNQGKWAQILNYPTNTFKVGDRVETCHGKGTVKGFIDNHSTPLYVEHDAWCNGHNGYGIEFIKGKTTPGYHTKGYFYSTESVLKLPEESSINNHKIKSENVKERNTEEPRGLEVSGPDIQISVSNRARGIGLESTGEQILIGSNNSYHQERFSSCQA